MVYERRPHFLFRPFISCSQSPQVLSFRPTNSSRPDSFPTRSGMSGPKAEEAREARPRKNSLGACAQPDSMEISINRLSGFDVTVASADFCPVRSFDLASVHFDKKVTFTVSAAAKVVL